ncbi:hypothetical protein P872_24970 [Rhodonellum psychrophilum GCM71 = DSM 17998]|uniref:ABC transporter domain-containing protein n=2 Tax=Rhodonellum TaxID=336827 RepID=U5C8A5_9BACT|nr:MULTISPECIES: ABC transporter ATP-binding protein [Rhodonellum]ERM84412.1 hypothetical protein P872_24970 [Rhodonellum psychrophilum GCM71 = DSM 17998]MDO9553981.1 ABC transporter ATP-binding protein [Rhodonellum sp.]SDY99525.1 ABC transporter [Rhodonellum ikkaensis]
MLEIKMQEASKRFQYEWIFKNITLDLAAGSKTAIRGSNGSGKSTLLKCISGLIPTTEGKITYFLKGIQIPDAEIYRHLVLSAPYLELPEEFTLIELLRFHFKFKKIIENISFDKMMENMFLKEHQNKPISQFSSGMKQRLKIGLCFFSDAPFVLLDEPTSNLDERGINWYLDMVKEFGKERTILVCSNDAKEYTFCQNHINVEEYKIKQSI